jgi:hypothetical protein
MCQKNNPGTYQVRKLAGSLLPLLRAPCHLTLHISLPPTNRSWQQPPGTRSGWRPLAETCTVSFLCMRCLCHPRDTGTRPGIPTLLMLDSLVLLLHPWTRETLAWAEATEGRQGDAWEASLNELFWHRQQGLLQVLKAYTLYRPEQGYCQAQGPVAAVLLMHLPPEVSDLDPALRPSTPSDLRHPPPTPGTGPQKYVFLYFRHCSLSKASCPPISVTIKSVILFFFF